MTRLRIVTVIAFASVTCIVSAQPNDEPETKQGATIDELVADFSSLDLASAEASKQELNRRLNQLSKDLLKLIAEMPKHEKSLGEPKHPCEHALAVLRVKRGDPGIDRFLMKNICWFDNSDRSDEGLMAGWPCAAILAARGPTAAYEIVEYLKWPPQDADLSDRAIERFATIVATVYPTAYGGIEEAKGMLARAASRARNPEHIERLAKQLKEHFEVEGLPSTRLKKKK